MTALGSHIWISYSPDLHIGDATELMLEARRGAWWDANKIGLSPPPIETSRGWLVLYHGVRHTPSGCLYRLGLALFDLRIRKNACCEAIPGSSEQRPTTNEAAMSMTWFSRADTRWVPMATPSIFTTAQPTPALDWLTPASAVLWLGSMPTEATIEGADRGADETPALDASSLPSAAITAN